MEDDPALDEARAATKKLEEIKQKLEALNREPVDML
jgi:tetrahydromethanopterin S-methyltransferase subunit G